MANYLGETVVENEHLSPTEYAMEFIERYGQIEGDHHKAWVLDQVARILKGTPVIVKMAEWDNGKRERRIDTGEPSKAYKQWVIEMHGDGEYDYSEGIAP